MMLIDPEKLQRNKWIWPDDDVEVVPNLPMSKKDQDEELARIRKSFKLEDTEALHRKFEKMYGYRPVPPMSEKMQRKMFNF